MKKCIAILGVTILTAWTAAADDVPKGGAYLGYQYVRFMPGGIAPDFNANGGGGQFIFNFNGWLSAVADVGAVHNGDVTDLRLDSTFINFLAGPRFSIRRSKRFVPYFQALFGGVYGASSTQVTVLPIATPLDTGLPILNPDLPVTARLNTSETKFAMTLGGGLDIKINRHMSFRPIGVDYYLTKLRTLPAGGFDDHQNNLRYTAGVTFLFGGEKPTPQHVAQVAPPRTKTCPDGRVVNADAVCPKLDITLGVNATSPEVCQGDTTPVVATLPNGANVLSYAWSVNGQPVGQGPDFTFGTADRQPGMYKVALTVSGNNFNPASAETTITVREYQPPTGTAQANPAQVRAGEKSALTASFQGQCGGTIQSPTFEASEGSVQGDQFDSTGVQFDPANHAEQRKTVTITAKAADNRSVGTATTSVEVIKSAGAIRLPDVLFPANSSRVNNCGKRILLEQLRAYVERDPTGTVVLVGNIASDETMANLAEQRAMNAAAVITAGTGVCLSVPQSQVQISAPGADQMGVSFESGFCQASVGKGAPGTVDARRVQVWFVPTGGELPSSVTKSQSASALSVSSLGCPK